MSAARIAVVDCFSGVAGDMLLAALLDAGANIEAVRGGLERLGLPPFTISPAEVKRAGTRALYADVRVEAERTYQAPEMKRMVESAAIPARARERALAAISALEAGERSAHGGDDPHFHEVGGVDAMVDITGCVLALEDLGVAEVFCPVVTVGAGAIARSHGGIPASPGPAAAHILEAGGFALRFVEAGHELVTPTGAAILAAVARPTAATIKVQAQGLGAGTMDPPGRPNAVRVFVGAASEQGAGVRALSLLEANIDDMAPSLLAYARDRMMEEGALDAWFEPIGMKKGRAATKLCALVPREAESRFAALMMYETTTIGVRVAEYHRYEAAREQDTVVTSFGPVRVKTAEWQGRKRRSPEFEDVQAIARRMRMPAPEVQRRLEHELDGHG